MKYRQRLKRLSTRLKLNLPKSEAWFWEYYKKSGLYCEFDLSNEVFHNYVPDIINHKYKFIVEIDGSIHNLISVKNKDLIKTKKFNDLGYTVLRVNYYNYSNLQKCLKQIRILKKRNIVKPILKKANN